MTEGVSHTGLVPAMRLVSNVGLEDLVTEHVHVSAEVGANPGVKIGSLMADMIADADPGWGCHGGHGAGG